MSSVYRSVDGLVAHGSYHRAAGLATCVNTATSIVWLQNDKGTARVRLADGKS